MQRAAERLALGVRVGVSTGDVTEDNGDYFGPAVVEAKRLCDAAHPSRNCRRRRCPRPRRLREEYEYSVLAPFELKGLAGPRIAHEVNWSLDELPPLPRSWVQPSNDP